MNAQDDQLNSAPRDANLLAGIDRVLASPESMTHDTPDSFERFCVDLAAAAPQADPAFRDSLGRRLTTAVEQRHERARGFGRLRSLASNRPSRRAATHVPWQAARWRLTSVALAMLVAAGGIGAYLRGQSATPVSAQTVLHRAAAITPSPNEATHSTYSITAGGGLTGTADAWVGVSGTGGSPEFALTQTMFRNGKPAPDLSSRLVETDKIFQVYDPATNTVTQSSSGRPFEVISTGSSPSTPVQDLEEMFVGTLVATKFSRALDSGVRPPDLKLQQQTLNGTSVYALQLDAPASQTVYFNAQSYILEGADWTQGGVSWQARLTPGGYQTMAFTAVPEHAFTLNAPTNARVVTLPEPQPVLKGHGDDPIITGLVAACGTTTQAVQTALQAGDKSMLDICRETSPDMTADRLVKFLLGQFKSEIDAQIASGAITPAEGATELANLQTKLAHIVTDQPGAGPGSKQP